MVRHTDEYFVNVKGVTEAPELSPQSTVIDGTALDAPETDCLSGYSDASFGENIFNISVAEIETIVQPDSIANDVRRKSMTVVGIHAPILAILGS